MANKLNTAKYRHTNQPRYQSSQVKKTDKKTQVHCVSQFRSKAVGCNLSQDSILHEISDSDEESMDGMDLKKVMANYMIDVMLTNPSTYIGISKEIYYKMVLKNSAGSCKDIMMTLRKIRLNESFKILSIYFGMTPVKISSYVPRFAYVMSARLKTKMFSPSVNSVTFDQYPVQLVIASFAVHIQKSRDPKERSLTQATCKSCASVRFVISITPDGIINYVSEGFYSGLDDRTILKRSGLLERTKGTVLALNGFEGLEDLLEEQGRLRLIRLPSEETIFNSNEVVGIIKQAESVIDRVRKFKMISESCLTEKISYKFLTNAVVIACGLVNYETTFTRLPHAQASPVVMVMDCGDSPQSSLRKLLVGED